MIGLASPSKIFHGSGCPKMNRINGNRTLTAQTVQMMLARAWSILPDQAAPRDLSVRLTDQPPQNQPLKWRIP